MPTQAGMTESHMPSVPQVRMVCAFAGDSTNPGTQETVQVMEGMPGAQLPSNRAFAGAVSPGHVTGIQMGGSMESHTPLTHLATPWFPTVNPY